jgi:hypothetical protein
MRVPEHAPAHGQDHRPVPPQQRLKSGLIISFQKGAEELAVTPLLALLVGGQAPDVSEEAPELCGGHRLLFLSGVPVLCLIVFARQEL